MKKPFLLLSLTTAILTSCHKDKNTTPTKTKPEGLKIEIIKGNNQIDTLGKVLKDSITVKVTNNGNIIKNAYIRFQTLGCDNNTSVDIPTYKTGLVNFQWRLNGPVGKQSLKVIFLDSLKIKRDSIEATATGIMPTHGWYRSSCTPANNAIVNSLCKLSSGRLIAAFNAHDYPYYSDDNAITWHPLKTFPLPITPFLYINKLIATSTDEIFAATQNNGLYYSRDGGQSWEIRSAGITDMRYFVDMNYTKSGKLIYTTYFGGIYLSVNKGVTWKSIMTGLSYNDRFYYPSEQVNGDLYVVNDVGDLYKSVNSGMQWNRVLLNFTYDVQSLFIDNNGYFFVGASNYYAELYLSTDNSIWSKIYTAPPIPGVYREIQKMSKQDNGKYYFYTYGNGLISTSNFKVFENIASNYTEQSRCYITTKDGNLVIGTQFNGIYFNLP
ncbi:hypothetical protein LLH06_00435 [Mucilaginibacter daejeonensis]|uniref:hypothetical protein n=1 Tax=Mucilaginibacter daejeonensis TaxID=398049 RepID=UPI001D1713FD|nr:hypothetical protein [Mucilaginibacter daejeonensis]UEG53444.1 hypothetical protein LLH06_00435 [Mucilaginibacter daejeonensis]